MSDPLAQSKSFSKQVEGFLRAIRFGGRERVAALLGCLLLAAAAALPFLPGIEFPGWAYLILSVAAVASFAFSVWLSSRRSLAPEAEVEIPAALKGAGPFTADDGALFLRLERRDELARLKDWVNDDQVALVALKGESGVGKTSLLRAGLPEVLGDAATVVYWEALPTDAEARLLRAVHAGWKGDAERPASLADLTSPQFTTALSQTLCIVVDQLEQISSSAQPGVFDILREAMRLPPPYRVTWVVAFRNEYASEWIDFEAALAEDERPRFRLLSLVRFTVPEAERAAAVLVETSRLEVDRAVVREVIAGIAESGRVAPVDLGISLLTLGSAASSGSGRYTVGAFRQAGGQEGLLRTYIETQFEGLPPAERRDALNALLRLVDLSSNQRLAEGKPLDDLAQAAPGLASSRLYAFLSRLAARHVRVLEEIHPESSGRRFRLMHDRFVTPLRTLAGVMLAGAQEASLALERSYFAWLSLGRPNRLLLSGQELRQIVRHLGQLDWRQDEAGKRQFLQAGRRRWTLSQIVAGLSVAAVLFGLWSGWRWIEAEKKRAVLVNWELPGDLLARQVQLKDLRLPKTVRNLEWLADNLKGLELSEAEVPSWDGLPPSLESFRFTGTTPQQWPRQTPLPENLIELRLSDQIVNVRRSWPGSLRSLDLSGSTLVGLQDSVTLPIGLSRLDLTNAWTIGVEIENLPLGLQSLSVSEELMLGALPDGLRSLKLSAVTPEAQLRSFDFIQRVGLGASLREATNLRGSQLLSYSRGEAALLQILLGLPSQIAVKERSWVDLPRSLKDLGLIGLELTTLEGMPASLERLDLSEATGLNTLGLATLPPGLSSLTLAGTDLRDLEGLPRSLTSLDLSSTRGLRWETRDLSDLQLPDGLRSLNLSRNLVLQLAGLPPSLVALDLSSTRILGLSDLPPKLTTLNIANTRVTDLKGLPETIESLDLSGTPIASLEPLRNLKVRTLILSGLSSPLLILPAGIPESVTSLDVSGTGIRSLEGLPKSLKILNLSRTSITSLEGLPEGLEELTLSTGQVRSLAGMPRSVRVLRFLDP